MKIIKSVQVIDYHATGEPMRICPTIVHVPGETMMDKFAYAREHLEQTRRFLANEPRGHGEMMGCLLTEPVNAGSLFGVLFFDTTIFNAACGHGSIALATAAIEQGWVAAKEGENKILFDIPCGQIEVRVIVENGDVETAIYRGVPSFVHQSDVEVVTRSGLIKLDVAFGGVFFAIIDMAQFGDVMPSQSELFRLYFEIKEKLDATGTIVLPDEPSIRDIDGVHFMRHFDKEGYAQAWDTRSIFSGGALDRSPCGTGTCATLANFYRKGMMKHGDKAFARSAPGDHFIAQITDVNQQDGRTEVTSEIRSRGYLTGYGNLVLTKDDPLGVGFVISRSDAVTS